MGLWFPRMTGSGFWQTDLPEGTFVLGARSPLGLCQWPPLTSQLPLWQEQPPEAGKEAAALALVPGQPWPGLLENMQP